ncbi:MAG: penicillin-binding protein 2 [Bacillota bacterium]
MDRVKLLRIIVIIIFAVMLTRAGYLQIVKGNYYYELSEGNRISIRPINAPRGKILDRKNQVIVSNKLTYSLYLLPNEIPPGENPKNILKNLSETASLDYNILLDNYTRNSTGDSLEPIILKRHLKKETMVVVAENSDMLPGIFVKESSLRDYVYPETMPHATGYIGEINKNELIELNEAGYNYSGGDLIGKSGLEREYELYLRGEAGAEQIEVNSRGRKVKTIGIKNPEAGNNLILNIDFDLQQAAEKVLEENFEKLRREAEDDPERNMPTGAAAVVMDIRDGSILSITSIPDFSLNLFARGISESEYKSLLTNRLNPLIDRTTMSAVPPGSIFKLITGTAAVEELGVRADTNFYDSSGVFYLPNWSRPFRNWHYGGEGKLDFTKAIARSNNIIFYQLGFDLYEEFKGEMLAKYARQYGLGEKTGIDLPGEKPGFVPDNEWKQKNFSESWYPGDSVNLSIGQGGLLTTPIQITQLIASIAGDGILYKPQIVDKIVDVEGEILVDFKPELKDNLDSISPDTFSILKEGMYEVTNESYGTAYRHFENFPIKTAGKTGTAQTSTENNHGWFGGFAPYKDPEIAVLVFLENGGSSSFTVPIARDIMSYYFGFKNYSNGRKKIYYHSRIDISSE